MGEASGCGSGSVLGREGVLAAALASRVWVGQHLELGADQLLVPVERRAVDQGQRHIVHHHSCALFFDQSDHARRKGSRKQALFLLTTSWSRVAQYSSAEGGGRVHVFLGERPVLYSELVGETGTAAALHFNAQYGSSLALGREPTQLLRKRINKSIVIIMIHCVA